MKNDSSTIWVLLRGLGREVGHWGAFLDQFRQSFPNDEVLAIDLPGVGEYRAERSPIHLAGIQNFVRAKAIEKARSQAQFKLVAISLGAMVAMEWMRQRPDDLAGAVLINTSVKSESPIYNRLRWQVWPQFAKAVATQSVKDRERRMIDLLINSEVAREKALPVWTKLANERPTTYLNVLAQLTAASRFEGLSEPTSVPVLLLSGLGDRFVDPSCSSRLRDRWGWPLEQHAWAGHDLTWDDPDWTLQKIKAWNQTVDTSRQ